MKSVIRVLIIILLPQLALADGDGGMFGLSSQQMDTFGRRIRLVEALQAEAYSKCIGAYGYKDENFCNQVFQDKTFEALDKADDAMLAKLEERQRACLYLEADKTKTEGEIQATKDEVAQAEEEIQKLVEAVMDARDKNVSKEEMTTLLAKSYKRISELQTKADQLLTKIKKLMDGSGSCSSARGNTAKGLKCIESLLTSECAPAELKKDEFNASCDDECKETKRNIDDAQMQVAELQDVTVAQAHVALVKNVTEDSPELETSRENIRTGLATATADARDTEVLITGGTLPSGNQQTDGLKPTLVESQAALRQIQQLQGITDSDVDKIQSGGCVGANCSGPGGGSRVVVDTPRPGPQDGAAYGGGNNGNKTGDGSDNGKTNAMAKTGSDNNGMGGFGMPSLGSNTAADSSFGKTADYTNQYGSIANRFEGGGFSGNTPSGYNGFNRPSVSNSPTRNLASVDSGSGGYNGYSPSGSAGGGSGGSAGGAAYMPMNDGGGSGGYNNGSQGASRPDKKGNKQLYSAKSEKAGGSGTSLTSREQARKAALDARMDKLKAESKLAGKDAFDPDKYVPKTAAEKLALARASGKLAGYSNSKEWPNDISRQRDQDIFNLMLKGYKKHLQEKNL